MVYDKAKKAIEDVKVAVCIDATDYMHYCTASHPL